LVALVAALWAARIALLALVAALLAARIIPLVTLVALVGSRTVVLGIVLGLGIILGLRIILGVVLGRHGIGKAERGRKEQAECYECPSHQTLLVNAAIFGRAGG
jgi:hypothetical protein